MKTLAQPQDAAEIRTRLRSLTQADEAQWGIMTAAQMVCHVRGAFLLAMSDAEVVYVKTSIPPGILKRIALNSPMPWAKNFPTVPALKMSAPAMQPGSFAADHASLIDAFDQFYKFPNHTHDHAFFHSMTHADWMRWGYLHTDHHLRQFNR